MAQATVWFVVDYAVDVAQFSEFERLAQLMSEKSAEEPGTLMYKWCLSPDRTQCRLLESYVDAAAALAHITGPVIHDLVPLIEKVSKVTLFEVYGDAGPEATAALRDLGATVYKSWRGYSR